MKDQQYHQRHLMLWGLSLILALVLGTGCGDRSGTAVQTETPIPVQVVSAEQGAITEYIVTTGRIAPYIRVNLATKLQGRVEAAPFHAGQSVRAGDLLVKVDAADVEARKAQAMAARTQAQASLRQLEASEREAQAVLQNARSELARIKGLFDRNAAPRQQYDQAVTAAEVAEARLESLSAQRGVLRASTAVAEEQIREASAILSYAEVHAPFDGVISSKSVEPGDMSSPGMPMLTLEDLSRVKIELVVAERDIVQVRPETPVKIHVDALPGEVFSGKVETVIPSGDPLSHSFRVEVVLDNAGLRLKPGMFVRAQIIKDHRNQALKIPLDSILEEGDHYFVFRIENNRAIRVNIKTGLQDLHSMEVLEGLSPGDRVVTRGKENLTSQALVRVINS